MSPNWYPGYYLDPRHWPDWMPQAFPHWLPASLVRTPPAISPQPWPEPPSKPSYGLLDGLMERLRPKSFEEQLAALPTLLPDISAESKTRQANADLWGGLLPINLPSRSAPWPHASTSLPPSAPESWSLLPGATPPPMAKSSPPLFPRWPDVVPTTSGLLARIAGWFDAPSDGSSDAAALAVQWPEPSAAQFPAMPPAPPLPVWLSDTLRYLPPSPKYDERGLPIAPPWVDASASLSPNAPESWTRRPGRAERIRTGISPRTER